MSERKDSQTFRVGHIEQDAAGDEKLPVFALSKHDLRGRNPQALAEQFPQDCAGGDELAPRCFRKAARPLQLRGIEGAGEPFELLGGDVDACRKHFESVRRAHGPRADGSGGGGRVQASIIGRRAQTV
jgi:hypothetical protein